MQSIWQKRKVLITVRTYPLPAQKGIEVSCTAAISDDTPPRWIRLFPVPYRILRPDQQFHKYQWIEASLRKASDPRPESHNINGETIRLLDQVPAARYWVERKLLLTPLMSRSMCEIQARHEEHGEPTLGMFKPKRIVSLRIIPEQVPHWTEDELKKLHQETLFEKAPTPELEKIPFRFVYRYFCDEPDCHGHNMHCTDWEMAQSFRKWRRQYRNDWKTAFLEKYERQMKERYDTYFFVGNMAAHPENWIIIGLFNPLPEPLLQPRQPQLLGLAGL